MTKRHEPWHNVAAETGENLLEHLRLASLDSELSVADLLKLCTAYRTLTETLGEVEKETASRTIEVIMSEKVAGYAI